MYVNKCKNIGEDPLVDSKKHGYFGLLRQWLDLSNVFAGPHLTLMSKPSDPTQNTVFKRDPRDVWF